MNTYQRNLFMYAMSIVSMLACAESTGQSNDYKFIAVDFESREPLKLVEVHCLTLDTTFVTSASGEFSWLASAHDSLEIRLTLLGYKSLDLSVFPAKDSLQTLYMFQSAWEFPTVVVSTLPKIVYSNDTMNVADYVFIKQGTLILTYQQERRWKKAEEAKVTLYMGCQLVLLDHNNKVVQAASISEDCMYFYKDYPGEVFLKGRYDTYWVGVSDNSIVLQKITEEDFRQTIEPIVDTLNHFVYYSNYNIEFPAFDYYQYNAIDSTFELVQHMEDEEMMRMLRSEYKYLTPREKLEAYRFQMETGMDKEVAAAYMRGFQNTHYYEPLNAPMFVHNSEVVIFDHHHHKALNFDLANARLEDNAIAYHQAKRPKWAEKVWKDKTLDLFFTSYSRNGFTEVHQIGRNGQHHKCMDLRYQFVEFLTFKDGYVYYIYRPFESSQNRYLYKEKIYGVKN